MQMTNTRAGGGRGQTYGCVRQRCLSAFCLFVCMCAPVCARPRTCACMVRVRLHILYACVYACVCVCVCLLAYQCLLVPGSRRCRPLLICTKRPPRAARCGAGRGRGQGEAAARAAPAPARDAPQVRKRVANYIPTYPPPHTPQNKYQERTRPWPTGSRAAPGGS